MSALSENEIIKRFFAPLSGPGGLRLIDDAAWLPASENDLVVTTDTVIAGVHFFETDPPESVAAKALRVNVSDLAAKAATPLAYVMALSLPFAEQDWLARFSKQLRADQEAYGIALVGGDTTHTHGPLTVTITAFGSVPPGKMVKRSGARKGDVIAVTGTIGDAALACALVKNKKTPHEALLQRYRYPEPRAALALALRACAGAAMDVSDGLVGDLAKLCAASGVSAQVDVKKIPFSPAARAAMDSDSTLRSIALTGGDDYEILCAVREENWSQFQAMATQAGVPACRIGFFVGGVEPPVFRTDGQVVACVQAAYQHF